ncbi:MULTISPECIES: NUDIX hydrolase [unclassified Halomonas]|uniref:NUDIX hydrolase n=1 Tax=unclassified Halomonas TaxID=2609666 RepID=UPI0009905D73|nr:MULTISPECIES: NUDIX domain-containing protein [unclassified Halomonas]AQU82109.1 DNA mismatch repair protein MutT [Halomonas sp. 'Soap Lake \
MNAIEGREALPSETSSALSVLKVAAAVVSDPAGRLLLVRKRGTRFFMQPGGKIEPGETALIALCRELKEEIGLCVDMGQLLPLGLRRAMAANEPDTVVEAHLFGIVIDEQIHAGAEIDEAVWVTHEAALELPLAPLTQNYVVAV